MKDVLGGADICGSASGIAKTIQGKYRERVIDKTRGVRQEQLVFQIKLKLEQPLPARVAGYNIKFRRGSSKKH